MQIGLIVLFAAAGVSVGVLQVWLLSRLLSALTAKRYESAVLPLLLKTAVYAVVFTAGALLFTDLLIPLGAGVGAGLAIGAFVSAAIGIRKNK